MKTIRKKTVSIIEKKTKYGKNWNVFILILYYELDEEYALESEKCRIMENDILFTMTGTKGKKD